MTIELSRELETQVSEFRAAIAERVAPPDAGEKADGEEVKARPMAEVAPR